MQNYRIEYLPTAQEDLKSIADWYMVNFSGKSSAKVINSILSTVERLAMFPNSGSLTPDKFLNKLGYRMVIIRHHVAIYKFINNIIYIYHVADTRTEYTKLFYKPINN